MQDDSTYRNSNNSESADSRHAKRDTCGNHLCTPVSVHTSHALQAPHTALHTLHTSNLAVNAAAYIIGILLRCTVVWGFQSRLHVVRCKQSRDYILEQWSPMCYAQHFQNCVHVIYCTAQCAIRASHETTVAGLPCAHLSLPSLPSITSSASSPGVLATHVLHMTWQWIYPDLIKEGILDTWWIKVKMQEVVLGYRQSDNQAPSRNPKVSSSRGWWCNHQLPHHFSIRYFRAPWLVHATQLKYIHTTV